MIRNGFFYWSNETEADGMNNLKIIRELCGVSLSKLADKSGLGSSSICNLERQKRKGLPLTHEKILQALGVRKELVFPEDMEGWQ